jgi:DNA-binding Lrp family transcriptional regulator
MTDVTETDERVLAALTNRTAVGALADDLDVEPSALRDRLARLADDGLVVESEPGTFALTASGRRVLATSRGDETVDRATLSDEEVSALDSLDLAPDLAAAVEAAYLFLRRWGDATGAEIAAAVYSEHPARSAVADAGDWWENGVAEPLASLPTVDTSETPMWRCTAPGAGDYTADGRHVSGPYGSVRHAVEHLDGTDEEIRAVRTAFARLFWCGPVTAREFRETTFREYPAGHDDAGDWWEYVESALGRLPGVERGSDGDVWRYVDGVRGDDPPSEDGGASE